MSEIAQLFDRIIGRSHHVAGALRVKSALNPMLWLCAIVTVPSFVLAWLAGGQDAFSVALLCLGGLPVVVTCLMATFFAVVRPEKLQSEEYQIRHEAIELIRQKGSSEIEIALVDQITKPLDGGSGKGVGP